MSFELSVLDGEMVFHPSFQIRLRISRLQKLDR